MLKRVSVYNMEVESWSAEDGPQIVEERNDGRRVGVETVAMNLYMSELFLLGRDRSG